MLGQLIQSSTLFELCKFGLTDVNRLPVKYPAMCTKQNAKKGFMYIAEYFDMNHSKASPPTMQIHSGSTVNILNMSK